MRIAIISDIHGNCIALEAVLADLGREKVDHLVCLGDAIQGGPQPAEVVARLRDLACPVVIGNADAWLLTGKETGNEPITAERLAKLNEVRLWSLTRLSDEDQAFIAGFQPTVTIGLSPGRDLLCFHGSPASFDEIILPETPEEKFREVLEAYIPHILTGGHTHLQQVRRLGASQSFFFNPGSVGLAYSHNQSEGRFRTDPWAEHAVLSVEGGRLGLEFRRVPFDVAGLVEVYRASGRPHSAEAIAQYQ
jgi:predicted phosphodiesterase